MADDDLDYHFIVKCALEEVSFNGVLQVVRDGLELMDYLARRGKHKNASTPDLIILDLNMPGKDGRAALQEIKADPSLRKIPVAVLSSSLEEEDVEFCKRFKNCTFTAKPATFQEWTSRIGDILSQFVPSR
jgi:CheY-like chemotaxis protein